MNSNNVDKTGVDLREEVTDDEYKNGHIIISPKIRKFEEKKSLFQVEKFVQSRIYRHLDIDTNIF